MDEIFNVPEAGLVMGGILMRGVVCEGDTIIVGPREDGTFMETSVATIRRNRAPCRVARAGEAVTVTLANVDRVDIRKVKLRSMSNGVTLSQKNTVLNTSPLTPPQSQHVV